MGLFDFFKKEKKQARQPFEFPEVDSNGQTRLKIITTNLSGVTFIHDNSNPQNYLPRLKKGEQVFLQACKGNKKDPFAVKVFDKDGHYIGWLPAGTKDVFERLVNNETVLARFDYAGLCSRYDDDGEECFDAYAPYYGVISYARYAKIRKKS